jgi:cell wall-associated NlpC family hydrolase
VARSAQGVLGQPYRFGGSEPGGFDCSGLVRYAHRQGAGIDVPRTARDQLDAARPVALEALRPGDLLFFAPPPGKSLHVGIYVDERVFVHAPSAGKAVAYASLGDPFWSGALVRAGRLR